MFNENEYQTIISNCQKDDNLANALSTLRSESLEELSVVSHEIKNYAAYLKTSYQFIARKTPDLKDNKFWNNMGVTIDELVEYMNRTSLYRYSFKDSEINEYKVSDILDIVNKYINKKYTDKVIISADTSGVVALSDTHFLISSHLLTSGIGEIIDNAYEAALAASSPDNTTAYTPVKLCIGFSEQDDRIVMSISGLSDTSSDESIYADSNNNRNYNMNRLCEPFFTTKEKHTGLGLSIVNQMCILSGAALSMTYNTDTHMTTAYIAFKKA